MPYSNGKISPPLNQRDVQQALGISSPNWDVLCSSDNINKWARYKPIYCAEVGLLKNSQRQNSGHVVSGYSINFGVMKPSSTSWADYINTANGQVKSGKWGYDRPVGGSAAPYRLTDFVEVNNNGATTGYGYDHNAVCPISFAFSESSNLPLPYESSYDGSVMSFVFTFQNGVTGFNTNYCLSLGDIFAAELNFYPTVIMTCYQNGRIWEYSKSGDNPLSYYTGNVNPFVQVLVNTKGLCNAIANDGASYHSGPLADGQVWTCCMVLTSLKVAGGVTTHSVSSGSIRRLEYADGVDRRDLTVVNTQPTNYVTALSYTVTLRKSSSNSSYYYVESVGVSITTTGTGTLYFTVNALFNCMVGVIGGIGWSGNQQQESMTGWSALTVSRSGTTTASLNAYMPEFRFSGDLSSGTRIAAGSLTFKIGSASLEGSFGINVYGGASSYSQTVTIK